MTLVLGLAVVTSGFNASSLQKESLLIFVCYNLGGVTTGCKENRLGCVEILRWIGGTLQEANLLLKEGQLTMAYN